MKLASDGNNCYTMHTWFHAVHDLVSLLSWIIGDWYCVSSINYLISLKIWKKGKAGAIVDLSLNDEAFTGAPFTT